MHHSLLRLCLVAALLLSACDGGGGASQLPAGGASPADLPQVSIAPAAGLENGPALRFAVSLSRASSQVVTLRYATADGSASAGSDYRATVGQLSIPAGATAAEIAVSLIDDSALESAETFSLTLSAPVNASFGNSSSATGTISDDDTPVSVSISPAQLSEGQLRQSSLMSFTVRLSRPAEEFVSVNFASRDGSAKAGEDYTAVSGSVEFQPGTTQRQLVVGVSGDETVEPDEELMLALSAPVNASLGMAEAPGRIINDDVSRSFSAEDAAGSEASGALSFNVRLSQASGKARTVNYATANGTATAGSDYNAASGSLSFAAGETLKILRVSMLNDTAVEPTETLSLGLTAADDTALADATATGSILDDDTGGGSSSGGSSSGGSAAPNMDAMVLGDIPSFDRCDFLDNHYCTFPWPNDWFTSASTSSATGRQLNLNINSMPKNSAGKPLDPTEWNRNDGFSPGQLILVRIPGLDLKKSGAVPITNLADSYRSDQAIVVLDAGPAKPVDASYTPKRQLIWAELDANLSKFTTCASVAPAGAALGIAADGGAPGAEELRAQGDALRKQCEANPTPEDPSVDPGPALTIRPASNFTPGHRYIVALRNLKTASGAGITAPPAFQIYRDKAPTNLPMVEGRRAHFEDLFTTLAKAGIARSELYMAWDFTVISERNLSERVLAIRNDALAKLGDSTPGDGIVQGNSPVFTISSVSNSDGSSNTAREVRGVITVPSYLDKPRGVAGSKFYYQPSAAGLYGDNLPDINPSTATQQFDFLCRIPRRAFNGSATPATASTGTAQRPALYGHGLLGSKSEGGGQIGDIVEGIGMVYCATDWIGMASHDSGVDSPDTVYYDPPFGDVGNVATLLTDMSNFASLVDRLQQSFINFSYLGRAILAPNGFCSDAAFKAGSTCLLDRSRLYYDGNSQGGIFGGALTAINPDIAAATLGVPGMNYSTLLQRSVDFDQYAAFMYASYRSSLDQQFVLSFIQMLWDRADNNGYAQHLKHGNPLPGTPDRRPVMLHPAFGDHQVSMTTAEVMARSIGARLHCPAVVAGSDAQRGPAVLPGKHPAVGLDPLDNNRRHHDDEPYYGIPCIDAYPHTGNALVVWDSGPNKREDGSPRNDDGGDPSGVAPPPIDNRPPRPELGYGGDPHSFPRSTLESRQMKDALYRPGGGITDTCKGLPCVTRQFNPRP